MLQLGELQLLVHQCRRKLPPVPHISMEGALLPEVGLSIILLVLELAVLDSSLGRSRQLRGQLGCSFVPSVSSAHLTSSCCNH